jgi:hypothetical protein
MSTAYDNHDSFLCACGAGYGATRPWHSRPAVPVPPSAKHAAAEEAFRATIAQQIAMDDRPLWLLPPLCLIVKYMDAEVQSGRVRREAAGWLASEFYNAETLMDGQIRCSFLRIAVRFGRHGEDCQCAETVLAWGCCPSFVSDAGYHWRYLALGIAQQRWARTLLAYGAIPCASFNNAPRHRVFFWGCPGGGFMLQGIDLRIARPQWRRWHGRHCRRQWVMLVT